MVPTLFIWIPEKFIMLFTANALHLIATLRIKMTLLFFFSHFRIMWFIDYQDVWINCKIFTLTQSLSNNPALTWWLWTFTYERFTKFVQNIFTLYLLIKTNPNPRPFQCEHWTLKHSTYLTWWCEGSIDNINDSDKGNVVDSKYEVLNPASLCLESFQKCLFIWPGRILC